MPGYSKSKRAKRQGVVTESLDKTEGDKITTIQPTVKSMFKAYNEKQYIMEAKSTAGLIAREERENRRFLEEEHRQGRAFFEMVALVSQPITTKPKKASKPGFLNRYSFGMFGR
jgi:hypothetical protein